jgi:hypothetical protein
VKYDSKSIVGANATGAPDVVYTFALKLNGTDVNNQAGQLTVSATNCTSAVPAPSGDCTSPASITGVFTRPENLQQVNALQVSTYPNPFDDQIRFDIQSPVTGQGSLELYNLLGQKMSTIYQGQVQAGHSKVVEYKVPLAQRTNLIYIMRVNGMRVTGKLLNRR